MISIHLNKPNIHYVKHNAWNGTKSDINNNHINYVKHNDVNGTKLDINIYTYFIICEIVFLWGLEANWFGMH